MKVFKLLGEKLGTTTLLSTQQKVVTVLAGMTDDLSFEQIDVINDLILASVEANSENIETITADELNQLYFSDTKQMLNAMSVVMADFARSLPQPDVSIEPGKPKAQMRKTSKPPKQK